MNTMIDRSMLWFKDFLRGDDPMMWLTHLDEIVKAAIVRDSSCSKPAHCDDGAKIVGSVAFGKNCVVGHSALVVGPAIFGDNCVVGHCSEVARSIFGNDSRVAHFNYVGDSALGSRVNLGAGA